MSTKFNCGWVILALFTAPVVFAKGGGTSVGGGGSDCERRVGEIRDDILKWIQNGGAKNLDLTSRSIYGQYVSRMKRKLIAPPNPKAVVISCVSNEREKDEREKNRPDPELLVEINDVPKTCRGFKSGKDGKLHILCHQERFEGTSEESQYPLIHHEFAGLAGLEKNYEAASDYLISNQITGYLEKVTSLKLSVKRHQSTKKNGKPDTLEGIWKLVSCFPAKIRPWDTAKVKRMKRGYDDVRESETANEQGSLIITGNNVTYVMGDKNSYSNSDCQLLESGTIETANEVRKQLDLNEQLTDEAKNYFARAGNLPYFKMNYGSERVITEGCRYQRQQQVQGSDAEYYPLIQNGNRLEMDRDGFMMLLTCEFIRM